MNNLLDSINRHGAGVLPLLGETVCQDILAELTLCEFSKAKSPVGKNKDIIQNFTETTIDRTLCPIIDMSVQYIERKLNEWMMLEEIPVEDTLMFKEVRAQRYEPSLIGISEHRDSAVFKNLVVILLLQGESNFYVGKDKSSMIPMHAEVGSCIVMEAPGFHMRNIQPYHAVKNITHPRVTLGMRQGQIE